MKKVSEFVSTKQKSNSNLSDNPIYKHSEIQDFIVREKINKEVFEQQYKTFYDFYVIYNNPELFNIRPFLVYQNGKVDIKYSESEEEKLLRESKKLRNIVKTAYISKSVLSSNFRNIHKNKNKMILVQKIIETVDMYLSNSETKGLYIYGKSGIGKSFMMGALYNYLKDKGKEPAIIFYPEFLRKVKSEISSGKYIDIIDTIREQEILIIDDIGAENLGDFVRDEVLVPIINYRSDEKLLTFFTSNLDEEALGNFLTNTKDSVDEIKALRLLRRILDLAEVVKLDV